MSLLATLIYLGMTLKEIPRALWKQKAVNLFICEQCSSMILEDMKIFFQNIHKNNFLINTILETQSSFNINFIQEPFWSFLKEELISVIKECSNTSTPGPDKSFWRHLKRIIKDDIYLNKFINIANMYININH